MQLPGLFPEYVWNWRGQRTCHHALRFGQSLKQSFDNLMQRHGRPARFPVEPKFTHHDPKNLTKAGQASVEDREDAKGEETQGERNGYVVTSGEIDPEIARIVRCAYPLDLCLLGYDPVTGNDWLPDGKPLVDTGCDGDGYN